jgi:hypothetical protein
MLSQMASAEISKGIRDFDLQDPATLNGVPTLLSMTGLYTNIASKSRQISDTNAIVSFEVNSPLWSDSSHKERFVSVPPGGEKIIPTDTAKFTFPAKTVLIKNFSIDTIVGNPASRIYVETRMLVYQSNQKMWSGLSYKWRRNQTDADLVSSEYGEDFVHGVTLNGSLVGKRWRYPASFDCNACHLGKETTKRGSLGFITPQLNRIINGKNQLQRLVDKGVLSVNPIAGKTNAHRWYGQDETTATQEQRVRSYFASNCSHCHGNNNSLTAIHNFDYFNPAKKITTADDAGGYVGPHPLGYSPLITPGYPDSSFILTKMMKRTDENLSVININQMPPIATSQPDSAAIIMVKNWICSMKPGTPCALPNWLPEETFWADADQISSPIKSRQKFTRNEMPLIPQLRYGLLSLPANTTLLGKVVLRDFVGRSIPLQGLGNGMFRLPTSLNPGVYFLSAGSFRASLNYLP